MLYWTKESDTNNPVTYIDRKGRWIMDNQHLPEAGDFWSFQDFDGKMLYVRTPEGGDNYTFHGYKAKGLKHVAGKQVVGNPSLRNTGGVYIRTYTGAGCGLIVCDRKLKKEKWGSLPAPGEISRLTKKVYVRRAESTAGGVVTRAYSLFNKKGVITTYEFSYPE